MNKNSATGSSRALVQVQVYKFLAKCCQAEAEEERRAKAWAKMKPGYGTAGFSPCLHLIIRLPFLVTQICGVFFEGALFWGGVNFTEPAKNHLLVPSFFDPPY